MTASAPHCIPAVGYTQAPATRLASMIRTDSPAGCRVGLIGLADDLGVRLNSGRPGAANAPDAIRHALCRYGVAEPAGWDYPTIFDAGNIEPATGDDALALATTHTRISEAVTWMLEQGLFPIAIGGGHDLTFPFVRAVIRHAAATAPIEQGLYFDAHLDVRDTAGSGMPFRCLIEQCGVRALSLVGFNPLVNTREHVAWFAGNGGRFIECPRELLSNAAAPLFVSLDMDVLDAAFAPGVSALNPAGLSPTQLTPMIEAAGACPAVACFDIMEHCPVHDVDGRTARIAAHMLLSFLRGFSHRPIGGSQ